MKSLSLSKPLVIVMVGLPGAGKSFFAQQFSETFGAPVISYDRIRYELFSEPTYSKDEQEIVNRIAHYQLQETLKSKHTCIVDGIGEARADRIALRRMAKEADYDTLLIWVQTDAATSKQRATHRNKRRNGDAYNPSLTTEQYDQFAKRLTPPSVGEQTIVLSGKHTFATQLKVVLTKLTAPRQEAEKVTPPEREQPKVSRPGRRNILIR
jgi:predicted kinase